MGHIGPMHMRREADGSITLGSWVSPAHLNHQGAAHGGMIASLVDSAMGYLAARAVDGPVATVHLGTDFLGRVREGQWLEVRAQVDRAGKRLVYTACTGVAGGEILFKSSAVFAALTRPAA